MKGKDLMDEAGKRLASFAKDLPLDKAIDAACAASCGWGVVGAVRKAGSLAGRGSLRHALGALGGASGAIGGALTVAGIVISTYVATDQLMAEAGESGVDALLKQGVTPTEALEVVERLKISAQLKERLSKRIREHHEGIEVDCVVDEVGQD